MDHGRFKDRLNSSCHVHLQFFGWAKFAPQVNMVNTDL